MVLVATRDSRPLPAGGTRGSEEVKGAQLAASLPPFLGRERAAVDVGRSLRYHESDLRVKT